MIVDPDYTTILANLTRDKPLDLDDAIFGRPDIADTHEPGLPTLAVPTAPWVRREDGHSYIGLRIRQPIERPEWLAARLCSIALERQVHPVFLSYIPENTMQRYGFRVEQLTGLSDRAQHRFEQQLESFWQLALVIDASEIESLG